jgi:osmoprotectant transport system substrate-binding protein
MRRPGVRFTDRGSERGGSLLKALGVVLVLTSCASTVTGAPSEVLSDDVITVASFDFPESELLAEIYAQALERAGFLVEREFGVGPRDLLIPALEQGLVELVPEYQGSVLAFLGGQISSDGNEQQRRLEAALGEHDLAALDPAPAQDRNGFAVTTQTASRLRLRAISDLAPTSGTLTFGGPPECQDRQLCLAGLQDVYGLRFKSFVALDAGGPLTVRALEEGLVDVALLFTTSEALVSRELLLLEDDRQLEPAEHVVPVVHQEVLARFGPEVQTVLGRATLRLGTNALIRMNADVAGGTSIRDVASAWLDAQPSSPSV